MCVDANRNSKRTIREKMECPVSEVIENSKNMDKKHNRQMYDMKAYKETLLKNRSVIQVIKSGTSAATQPTKK